ncbi:hypothetical protein B0A55_03266 [Friedmanniomyces simplex]|uniref:TEA domain-containing protein n=1 Tax=Friedmanniomyces simplex TaxID=329884 RepID=A0A4U0XR39_9PEZI|nr:hypothetical protein B0A55_03266 [Friedmanniomyces simplex]
MLQPAARVLPSNARPLRDDGDGVQHASRVLQEHSGNRQQQNGYPASTIYEPKYAVPLQTENNWPATYQQYQQHVHHGPAHYGQQYAGRPRHSPYDYQHSDDERNDIKKAADLYRRFQECAGYTKYRSRQQKDDKAGQEQKWPDDLEEAFFRALVKYPPMGRRKKFHKDKQRGRNELIADYIQQLTGVMRGRKQVSSHIQVLKPFVEGVPQIMRYLSTKDMGHHLGGRHGSSHYSFSHPSGRHMSTYLATGLPYTTRSGAAPLLPPQAQMEEVRRLKHRLDVFEPKKFEMFVQRKYDLANGQTQEERLHTYTQSIDAPLGDDLQLPDWQAFGQNYPLLAAKHAQKPVDCNVVVADASIGFPSESFRDLSGVELGISFVCSSSHLDPDAKIRYRNTFYRKGQKLAEPEEFDAPLQLMENGRSVTTSLRFGSSIWAKMLHQLAARLMKEPAVGAEQHDTVEEVRNVLGGLTAMVEVIVALPHGHERILVMCWTFRKSSVATGRASWKRVLLPQQQAVPSLHGRMLSRVLFDGGVELGISFVCSSSHLDPDAKIRYRNTFYRKGQKLAEPEEFDAPLQLMENGRSVTTSLKFGSSIWAKMLHQLAARLMKEPAVGAEQHDAVEEVRNVLGGLTAMVEVIVASPHGRERILVMCWTFRKSSVATGRASWKRVLLPQQQAVMTTQYPEPTKSERVDSAYDYAAQYAELPALEVPTQPALRSPFEYESSTGSALSSATWPTAGASEGSSFTAAAQHLPGGVPSDFPAAAAATADNSFDFNAGSINLSYDPGLLDFSTFDPGSDHAAFDFGPVPDFTDPALDQYSQQSQQWYDSFDAAVPPPPLSARGVETQQQHYVPTAPMEGVVEAHPQGFADYDGLGGQYEQQQQQSMYPIAAMGQEQQAYGGAGQDAVRGGDPLGALADASYLRSLMPKQEGM